MESIKIVSDGKPWNTTARNHKGDVLQGITKIDIKIRPGSMITAILEFGDVELEMIAIWELNPLKMWADRKVGL